MANGTLKVSNIQTSSGSGTITLGQSGETVDLSNATTTLNSAMKNTPAFRVTNASLEKLENIFLIGLFMLKLIVEKVWHQDFI